MWDRSIRPRSAMSCASEKTRVASAVAMGFTVK